MILHWLGFSDSFVKFQFQADFVMTQGGGFKRPRATSAASNMNI